MVEAKCENVNHGNHNFSRKLGPEAKGNRLNLLVVNRIF